MSALHGRCFTRPRPWTETEFRYYLSSRHVFAAMRPQGFALGQVVEDEGELLTLAVAPEARRQGLARALVAEIEAEAAQRGARRLYLEVAADNDAALALYQAAGLREAGRRRNYYGPGVDALILGKTLPPP